MWFVCCIRTRDSVTLWDRIRLLQWKKKMEICAFRTNEPPTKAAYSPSSNVNHRTRCQFHKFYLRSFCTQTWTRRSPKCSSFPQVHQSFLPNGKRSHANQELNIFQMLGFDFTHSEALKFSLHGSIWPLQPETWFLTLSVTASVSKTSYSLNRIDEAVSTLLLGLIWRDKFLNGTLARKWLLAVGYNRSDFISPHR